MSETDVTASNGFKETELGQLPVEWGVVRLGEIAETTSGGTPSRKKSGYFGGVIPWIKSGELEDGSISKAEEYITEDGLSASNAKLFPPGTLLIALYGATSGKVGILTIEAASNQAVCAVFPKNQSFLSEFMMYCFMHRREGLLKERYGGAQPNISQRTLRIFPIPLPPLSEQRGIARVLNAVQREIAAQEQLIAAARGVKRALMARLFTYGPGAEPARTKETEFGQVPENWQILLLRDCALIQTGTTKGRKFGNSRTITVPYLRVANVQDGYLELSEIKRIRIRESELDRYLLRAGDVVLTEGGDFDKLGRGFIWRNEIPNCIHQNHVFAVRTDREILEPNYLAYLTQSDYGKSYFLTVAHRTTNLASINSTKLKAFPVVIPNLDEQKEIVRILSAADRKITAEEQRKAALQEVFRSLLGELMTGRIRIGREAWANGE